MKIIDSEYLLQICSTCVLVTRKQTVTTPVPKLIEMAIKDGHYGILEMLGNIIHYCNFLSIPPQKAHLCDLSPEVQLFSNAIIEILLLNISLNFQ